MLMKLSNPSMQNLQPDKWFANGDLKLSPTTRRGVNGDTYMDGRIRLTPDRLQRVKSALAKIGQGKSGHHNRP